MIICKKCGFEHNPEDAHCCGNCGNNMSANKQKWMVYNTKEYVIISKRRLEGIGMLIFGLLVIAWMVIDWFFPEITGHPVPYKQDNSSLWEYIVKTLVLVPCGVYSLYQGYVELSRSNYNSENVINNKG